MDGIRVSMWIAVAIEVGLGIHLARSTFRKRLALAIPMAVIFGVLVILSEIDPRKSLEIGTNVSYIMYLAIIIPTACSPVIAEITLLLWAGLAYSEIQEHPDSPSRGGITTFGMVSLGLAGAIIALQLLSGRMVFWVGM